MNPATRPSLGGRKPRPLQSILPAVAEEIRARADRSTYATVGAAARLSGIPERRVLQLIEDGRARTRRRDGEVLANLDDLDAIAQGEGWADPAPRPAVAPPARNSVAAYVKARGNGRSGVRGATVRSGGRPYVVLASAWGRSGELDMMLVPAEQAKAYAKARAAAMRSAAGDSPVFTAADLAAAYAILDPQFPGVPVRRPASECELIRTARKPKGARP
jgi:hypothetical protein